MLSEPCPSYHGIKLHETFGDMAFAIACRVLGLRDLGPGDFAVQCVPAADAGSRRCRCACRSIARTRRRWRSILSRHSKVSWVSYANLPNDPCYGLAQTYCPKGAGAVFTFGVRGGYEAGVNLVNNVQAVLASGECRRHALAHHPSGIDDASPALGRTEERGRRGS